MNRRLVVGLVLVALLGGGPAFALEALQPGMKAPTFLLSALDGKRVGPGSFPTAKAVLVVFWATWSDKSPEVLSRAATLASGLGAQGLVVLGVNVESPAITGPEVDAVRAAAGRLKLPFPVLLDRGLETFHAYGVVAVPSSILIGADGVIVGELASYPIAGREDFFDLVDATVRGIAAPARATVRGPQPDARSVRYFNLARTLVAKGQLDQATLSLQKAVEFDPKFALPRVLLGQLARQRALARPAINFDGQVVATEHVGEADRQKFLAESEALLTEAIRLDPASPAGLTELAVVLLVRGDGAKAGELLDRALALDGAYSPARSRKGALLLSLGKAPEGRAELEAAIRINPLDWRLHITAAEALEAGGLMREAAQAYRKGVELLWQARREQGRMTSGR